MERAFDEYRDKVESYGGMVEAVERGYPQREITESAFRFQREVDAGERVIVGINKFATEEEAPLPTLRIDPEVEQRQIARVTRVRAERDSARWRAAMLALREAAKRDENLMPHFLEGARAYATVGEMTSVLKEVYGVYRDPGYF
ncbi:MAG TPA: methylmalonyl-CoA mutase family protein, partial [Candidatus Dormibacteraeota bacterium]|nr:methylmalonyl-CoA mutase family protein [Candidatus Dormibacteraeota bacterium]